MHWMWCIWLVRKVIAIKFWNIKFTQILTIFVQGALIDYGLDNPLMFKCSLSKMMKNHKKHGVNKEDVTVCWLSQRKVIIWWKWICLHFSDCLWHNYGILPGSTGSTWLYNSRRSFFIFYEEYCWYFWWIGKALYVNLQNEAQQIVWSNKIKKNKLSL